MNWNHLYGGWYFSSLYLAMMSQKLIYRIYVALSVLLFILVFAGWGAGSHGHMFANKSEAWNIVLVLLVIALPPLILKIYRKSKDVHLVFSIFVLLLLAVELIVVCYLFFEFVSALNLATFLLILMCLSLLTQMFLVLKSTVKRP